MKFPAIHPRHFYRDPAESVRYDSEKKTCRGCAHLIVVYFGGGDATCACGIGEKWGKRCRFYRKKDTNGST